MTLLTAVFAAVICTFIWYRNAPEDTMKISVLCWMFWGASLMWTVDAVFEYRELGSKYFEPAPLDMLNDFFLGLSVIALAMVVWIAVLLFKDPKGIMKSVLCLKKS